MLTEVAPVPSMDGPSHHSYVELSPLRLLRADSKYSTSAILYYFDLFYSVAESFKRIKSSGSSQAYAKGEVTDTKVPITE